MISRPTAKDVANAAGVSLATVDRVLNGRPGVRKAKIQAVNDAIKAIGFERNQYAASLARRRPVRFAFVLPKIGDEFLDEIIRQIEQSRATSRAEMIEIDTLRLDEQDPHKTAQALSDIDCDVYDGIAVMAPEAPQIRDALQRLREKGLIIVSFVSKQTDETADSFIGIDNGAAGATAARLIGRFLDTGPAKIAVLTETMKARDSIERRIGFDAVINRDFQDIEVLPSLEAHGDPERTKTIIGNVCRIHQDLKAIYLMGSEARLALHAIDELNLRDLVIVAHEKTPATIAALQKAWLAAVINQDPGHLVRSAVRILKAKCENRSILEAQERVRIEILLTENL